MGGSVTPLVRNPSILRPTIGSVRAAAAGLRFGVEILPF